MSCLQTSDVAIRECATESEIQGAPPKASTATSAQVPGLIDTSVSVSVSPSIKDDVIDAFCEERGRFPHNPPELADFTLASDEFATLDMKKATRVFRKRMVEDRGYDTPTPACVEESAEAALEEYFALFEPSAISSVKREAVTLKSMLPVSVIDEKSSSELLLPGRSLSLELGMSMSSIDSLPTDHLCVIPADSVAYASPSLSPLVSPFGSDAADAAVIALDSVPLRKKFHVPLDEFLVHKCAGTKAGAKHYRLGLLLFIERLAKSKLIVLNAIQRVLADNMEDSVVQKAIRDLARMWKAKYPEDFTGNHEMERIYAELDTEVGIRRRMSTLSEVSADIIFLRDASQPKTEGMQWMDTGTGDWMSIRRRQETEVLPPTYLSTNDRVIVKHKKADESGTKRKRTFTRSKKRISHVQTIAWRVSMPLWSLQDTGISESDCESDEAKEDESSSSSSVEFEDIPLMAPPKRGTAPMTRVTRPRSASLRIFQKRPLESVFGHRAFEAQRMQPLPVISPRRTRSASVTALADASESKGANVEWDARWPYLTLYFEHRFPANMTSLDLSPTQVAEAWTLLKFDILARIRPREFANRGWTKGKATHLSPNVRSLIALFEAEAKWTQMCLISETKLAARAFKLKRLVKVALACIENGNVDTACAIRTGLFKKHIAALPMQQLTAKCCAKLEQLLALDDSRHVRAKELTKQRLAAGRPVLPLTAVYLDRLYRIEEAWKPLDDWANVHLRWLKAMHETVSDVFKAQRRAFEVKERRDIQLLLIEEMKLHCGLSKDDIVRAADLEAASMSMPISRLSRRRRSGRRKSQKLSDFIKF